MASDRENSKFYLLDALLMNLAEIYVIGAVVASIAFACIGTDSHYVAQGILKGLVWPYSIVEWNIKNG